MKNEKKIKKVHIWPSVVFLLLNLIMAIISFFAFMNTILISIATERLETSLVKADSVFSRFDYIHENENEYLKTLVSDGEITDSFFIYDKNRNIIASYGEETYADKYMSKVINDDVDIKYNVLYDLSKNNCLDTSGRMKKLFFSGVWEKINSASSDDLYNVLSEANFWYEYKISDNRLIMMRYTVPLYVNDYLKGVLVGGIAFLMLMITLFMFFINLIISFYNQNRMRKMLYTDSVTGGRSFLYFENKMSNLVQSHRVSYLVADLTVMKYRSYCNYHGIHAGEDFLEDLDEYLRTIVNHREIVAFAGKSSFALLLKYNDRESGEQHVHDIVSKLMVKYGNDGIVFHSGIFFPEFPEGKKDRRNVDPAECFNRAGAARASLTDESIAGVAVYNESILEKQLWEHKVGEKMDNALKNNEFQVYIQPKYNPVTEKLSGAEALVRWINEEDGFISPGKFIPIFEKNGFITKLDDFMILNVARLQSEWLSQGKEIVPISVNVSRAHFADPDLANHICEIVDQYNVPHKFIEIELTESAFFDDKEVLLNTVRELRRLGFEISMDDFGAGYSSLNSLKDLPLDVLKLDADFFRGEDSEGRGEIVVSQAIALAKKLNMRIVAEGIEHKEQVDFLAEQGCDMIQGFYYAKPMPANEYEERLSQ